MFLGYFELFVQVVGFGLVLVEEFEEVGVEDGLAHVFCGCLDYVIGFLLVCSWVLAGRVRYKLT